MSTPIAIPKAGARSPRATSTLHHAAASSGSAIGSAAKNFHWLRSVRDTWPQLGRLHGGDGDNGSRNEATKPTKANEDLYLKDLCLKDLYLKDLCLKGLCLKDLYLEDPP